MTPALEVARHVAERVASSADELNRLDAQAGDGDLGVTMRTAATLVTDLLPTLDAAPPGEALRACGLALARGAPSTAGTLVASALLRAAKTVEEAEAETSPPAVVAVLLESAAAGVRERGKAEVGSKTMLDALVPAAEAAREAASRGASIEILMDAAALAAENGSRQTRSMRPLHGRAGWLADRSAGHEDAGARLIAIALRAAADAVADLAESAERAGTVSRPDTRDVADP